MPETDVLRAYWDFADQPDLLEALVHDNPREEGEGVLDYAERIAIEAAMVPISDQLRERNRLRYADRMPKKVTLPAPTPAMRRQVEDAFAPLLVKDVQVVQAVQTVPRQLPHEHNWVLKDVAGKDWLVCEGCEASKPAEDAGSWSPAEEPPVEPSDQLPGIKAVPDTDDEWI